MITSKKGVSSGRKKSIGAFLGPALFIIIYWLLPLEGLSPEGKGVLATLAWVGVWWMVEFMPSGITGLIPIILFPLIGSLGAGPTTAAYANTTIFLLLGGFVLGISIEKWGLHNRIALSILNIVGTKTTSLFIGLLLTATFVSMWISNVATALMILPIATALSHKIVELMKAQYTKEEGDNFEKRAITAVVMGAIIGGSLTLIGTPTNTQLAGFYNSIYGLEVSFGKFMIFEFPIALVQLIVVTLVVTKVLYKMDITEVQGGKEYVREEKNKLGKMSFEQRITALIFAVTVFFWITRTFIWNNIIPGINDGMIAIVATVLLFSIPSKEKKGSKVLDKSDVKLISWDVLLMIGGGMAIAAGFSGTDLAEWVGNQLFVFKDAPSIVIMIMVTLVALAVTQVAPNTATGSILVPIAATLADSIGAVPLPLMTVAALGAGFAFTFPSGTPAMGVMYSTGKFTMNDLLKVGMPMVIVSLIMVVLASYLWLPIILTYR